MSGLRRRCACNAGNSVTVLSHVSAAAGVKRIVSGSIPSTSWRRGEGDGGRLAYGGGTSTPRARCPSTLARPARHYERPAARTGQAHPASSSKRADGRLLLCVSGATKHAGEGSYA